MIYSIIIKFLYTDYAVKLKNLCGMQTTSNLEMAANYQY